MDMTDSTKGSEKDIAHCTELKKAYQIWAGSEIRSAIRVKQHIGSKRRCEQLRY
jgi:hypothetical protein